MFNKKISQKILFPFTSIVCIYQVGLLYSRVGTGVALKFSPVARVASKVLPGAGTALDFLTGSRVASKFVPSVAVALKILTRSRTALNFYPEPELHKKNLTQGGSRIKLMPLCSIDSFSFSITHVQYMLYNVVRRTGC
jgi:hypothetical protein